MVPFSNLEEASLITFREENNIPMKTIRILALLVSTTVLAQDLQKVTISAKGVTALRFTPDNQYFVMADGSTATLYNSGNDTKIKDFTGTVNKIRAGHSKSINDVAFSNSSEFMVTASSDKTVKIWKMPSGEVTLTLPSHDEGIIGARFAGNEKSVLTVSEDGTLKLWNTETNTPIYSKKDFQKAIRGFDVSADGKYVAIGGAEKFILVYDAATGTVLKKLDGHTGWVRSIAFSPDGKTFATGGDDKMIYLWETESGNRLKEFPQRGWVYDLEFSQDGKYLGAALEKQEVHFYNVSSGLIAQKLDAFKSAVFKLAISPGGKEAATIEEFGTDRKSVV